MNRQAIYRLVCLGLALFSGGWARGQILDGRVVFDTAYHVSLVTGYPFAVVQQVVPTSVVTSITNGNLLAGTNLSTPTPVTLGTPATGLQVTWEYSVVAMADGSGLAIFLDITSTPSLLGQSAPTTARYIVARPNDVRASFKDRTQIISQVLSQMYQYYYYTGSSGNGGTSGGTLFYLFPYFYWYDFVPSVTVSYPGSVSIGPTVIIGPI